MLPPVGTTFNFTFDGLFNTMHVTGIYTIQAVVDQEKKNIIGYRNWQLFRGEFNRQFYGLSYLNGTYVQAAVDTNTNECYNIFVDLMKCTSWSNTGVIKWDSQCSVSRLNPVINSDMSLILHTSLSDLQRPVDFIGVVSSSNPPGKTIITSHFQSKTEQTNFRNIKCSF